ncbi:uncharacterized protein PAC_08112 [Phialocephala subalpina]|uniref:C2H2-type domain-containing protein n=1 Tax=Phialocephala subalpina TaxID=576137 RepID=A0A1L7WZM8_9HELO|nr:uncharacterized protein PAC_08112 [Phialocephala subalpina]
MDCAAGMGFENMARLKEHLHRTNSLPITCSKCGTKSRKQNDLAEHTRKIETNGCLNLNLPAPKGMDPDIKAKLKSRAKLGKDQEEQWFEIYHLLFRPRGFGNRTTQLQDTDVSNHISELPLLLDRKPEDLLSHLILDTEIRGEMKRNFISDAVVSMKQPLPNFPATPMSLDESKKSDTCPPGTPGQTLVTPHMYQDQDAGITIA